MGPYIEDDKLFWRKFEQSDQNLAEDCSGCVVFTWLCLPQKLKFGSLYVESSRNRIILVTMGVAGGLLSIVGLAALVRRIGTQRKSGGSLCPPFEVVTFAIAMIIWTV